MEKYKLLHFSRNSYLKLLNASISTIKFSIALISILVIASNAMATTYYIDYQNGLDSNDGIAKSSPWKRCPGMNGFAGSYSHSAGDKFIFKGGVTWLSSCFPMTIGYSGSSGANDEYTVDETWYSGGSYSAPVFDGENLHGGANDNFIYGNDGTAYYEINGLKIIDVGVSGQLGGSVISLALGESMVISNLEIIGYAQHGIVFRYGNTAITNGVKIRNCKLSHLTNHIEIGNSGIVTNTISNVEISGNEFFDPHTQLVNGDHGDGIHIWNTGDNRMFVNLLIFNNKFYGEWAGADADTSNTSQIYLEDSVYSGKVYNNHLTFSSTDATRQNYIFSPGMMVVGASNSMEVYNNTICSSKMATRPAGWESGTSYGAAAGIYIGGTGTMIIKGNIVTDAFIGINLVTYDRGVTCDYNVVQVRPGGYFGRDISTWCSTLAAWQTQGFGTNSVDSNPLFKDIVNTPLDLSLQEESPAINLFPTVQAPTSDFTDDINGMSRPQGSNWDVGAYEGASESSPSALSSPQNLRILIN